MPAGNVSIDSDGDANRSAKENVLVCSHHVLYAQLQMAILSRAAEMKPCPPHDVYSVSGATENGSNAVTGKSWPPCSVVTRVAVLPTHTHNWPAASPVTTTSAPSRPHTAVTAEAGADASTVPARSPGAATRLRPLMPQKRTAPVAPPVTRS